MADFMLPEARSRIMASIRGRPGSTNLSFLPKAGVPGLFNNLGSYPLDDP